jgi:hypothetical protein
MVCMNVLRDTDLFFPSLEFWQDLGSKVPHTPFNKLARFSQVRQSVPIPIQVVIRLIAIWVIRHG